MKGKLGPSIGNFIKHYELDEEVGHMLKQAKEETGWTVINQFIPWAKQGKVDVSACCKKFIKDATYYHKKGKEKGKGTRQPQGPDRAKGKGDKKRTGKGTRTTTAAPQPSKGQQGKGQGPTG